MSNDLTHPEPPSATPVSSPEPAAPAGPTAKTWVIGGVAAAVIAAGAIIGLQATSSDSGTVDTAAAQGDQSADQTGQATRQSDQGAGANGQGRRLGPPGTFGTISQIEGSGFTVTAEDGTSSKVTTSDDTTFSSNDEGTTADLQVGDNIRAMGSGTSSALTADRVVDSGDVEPTDGFGGGPGGGTPPAGRTPPDGVELPEGFTPPDGVDLPEGVTPPDGGTGGNGQFAVVSGTIAAIDGATVTVTLSDGGTATVTLGASTTVTVTKAITFADLADGDTVQVRGETGDDGTVVATVVTEGATSFGGPGFRGGQPGSASGNASAGG